MLRPRKQWLMSDQEKPAQIESNVIIVDKECLLSELDLTLVEQLHMDAAQSGRPPHVLLEGLEVTQFRTIGHEHQHLKLMAEQDSITLECIGHELGYLAKHITLHSFVNVVGEPVIHEWNGFRKIQMNALDLAIPHLQIFDFRETKEKKSKLSMFFDQESLILCFRNESIIELGRENDDVLLYTGEWNRPSHPVVKQEKKISRLFLYDMPYSFEDMKAALASLPCPERIYCLFGDEYKDRLATLPSREQFKWFYSVLLRNKLFKFEWIPKLSKSRGISEKAIEFMLEVFADLDFIRRVAEGVELCPSPPRRDLAESMHYQRKQKEMGLETEILYSSYGVLCKTLKEVRLCT